MSSKSALILGSTGATGKHVLKEVLASPEYTRVGEFGRRVTSEKDLPADHAKLEQHTIDFDKLTAGGDEGLKAGKWDVVIIVLGTTKAVAGSAAVFEKIDREYVVAAAKAAKVDDSTHFQRLVYLSSTGANAESNLLYSRSKGLTEQALAKLGYADTIVFRPGFLADAVRSHSGGAEQLLSPLMKGISYFSSISSKVQIPVSELGKAIARVGIAGSNGLPASAQATQAGAEGARFTVIANTGALNLAKQ